MKAGEQSASHINLLGLLTPNQHNWNGRVKRPNGLQSGRVSGVADRAAMAVVLVMMSVLIDRRCGLNTRKGGQYDRNQRDSNQIP